MGEGGREMEEDKAKLKHGNSMYHAKKIPSCQIYKKIKFDGIRLMMLSPINSHV